VLASSGIASADAVKNTNASIGLAYSNTDLSRGDKATAISANAAVHLPVAKWIGVEVAGTSLEHTFELDDGRKFDSDFAGLSSTVFVNNPEIGGFGVGVSRFRNRYTSGKEYSGSTFLRGEYYIKDFNFSASRSRSKDSGNATYNSISVSGLWYAQENMSIGTSVSGMDSKDNYGLTWRHQPKWTKNMASYSLGYRTDREREAIDTYSVQVSYHFGSPVSIKERDRAY
jgi:hypothetical protein